MRRLLLVATLFLAACGYAPHKDPPLHLVSSPAAAAAAIQARVEAASVRGQSLEVVCCGSMEPLIKTGDFVVASPVVFDDRLLGKVVAYRPKWNPGIVSHRLVSGNSVEGFIASGDNNPRSEASERVTKQNFVGEIVSIYRVENKPSQKL